MNQTDKLIELKNFITTIADKKTGYDADEDYELSDYAGGNLDDAYSIGAAEGEIYFTRELLSRFFKE